MGSDHRLGIERGGDSVMLTDASGNRMLSFTGMSATLLERSLRGAAGACRADARSNGYVDADDGSTLVLKTRYGSTGLMVLEPGQGRDIGGIPCSLAQWVDRHEGGMYLREDGLLDLANDVGQVRRDIDRDHGAESAVEVPDGFDAEAADVEREARSRGYLGRELGDLEGA